MLKKPFVLYGLLRPVLRKLCVLYVFLKANRRKPYVLHGFLRRVLRKRYVFMWFAEAHA